MISEKTTMAQSAVQGKIVEKTAMEKIAKPAKKTTKEKDVPSRKPSLHPAYFLMIKEAILALKEKSGSSPYAIAKHMEEKYKSTLPSNFRKTLAVQLRNSLAKGKLVKVRSSFKLSEAGKKNDVAKKLVAAAKKKSKSSSTAGASKKTKPIVKKKMKKTTPAKPKQPKSIKSPTTKRAAKPVV
ncbi:histone H1-3 [Wolffia australiana]